MSASYVLFARLVKAAIAFFVLHAILFAAPAILSGDPNAIQAILLLWSSLSLSILAALLIVVLPLTLVLGTPLDARGWNRGMRWSFAGALAAGAAGFFFVPGTTSVIVPVLSLLGGAAGLGAALLNREPRRWAVN